MCTTGLVVIDNLCQLALRTGGIAYLFALALVLTVIASAFLAWKKLQPLVSPYRNEMRVNEYLLYRHYAPKLPPAMREAMGRDFGAAPDDDLKLTATELQGLWQAIGYGTLSRAIIVAAVLIPLLLIAR